MNIVRKIDNILDHITMYRLVLYILRVYISVAVIEAFLGLVPFSPVWITVSTVVLVAACWASNLFFSRLVKAPTNVESYNITALILTLIITPAVDLRGLFILAIVGIIAMSSKYVLIWHKKHIFNPAAIAVVISGVVLSQPASWWIGTFSMAPFLIVGGIILVRKLRFGKIVTLFLGIYILLLSIFTLSQHGDLFTVLPQLILNSSLIFMATIMFVEPQTFPGIRSLRYAYASIVALLSSPYVHFGNFYLYPEQALVIGNFFTFITGSKGREILTLKEKVELSKGVWEFVFTSSKTLPFKAGQYLEWMLSHSFTDRRGSRRFFTIASSPQDKSLKIGVKFEKEPSSYKRTLMNLKPGDKLVVSNLWGNFTLPSKNQKIALIAGGIGVTPYASMVRSLLASGEKRDLVLLYSNTHENEISYRELFDQAEKEGKLKVIYTLTGDEIPSSWRGEKGRVSVQMLERQIPDYKERLFYVSGSKPLTDGIKKTLKEAGVSSRNIKTDYFPGYA